MTAAPLVSVLIPAYNHEAFVTAALDSVAAETWSELEILVRDDGSTDETGRVIEDWIAEHPHVRARLWRQENAGIAPTLNRLLADARGAWVVPLASDDELIPGGISARLHASSTQRRRAIFGDAEVIDAAGRLVEVSSLRAAGSRMERLCRDPAAEIISRWRTPGPVLLVETAALRSINGWSEDLFVEDWDLYLRLAARGWLGYTDEPVARYRVHGANVSMDAARRGIILASHRRTARRNARSFRGRKRYALLMQQLVYRLDLVETEFANVRHLPARATSKLLRTVAEIVAG